MNSFLKKNKIKIIVITLIILVVSLVGIFAVILNKPSNVLDYNNNDNWIYFENDGSKPADTFIVAPCIDVDPDHRTADLKDEKLHNQMKIALDMQKGIYDEQTNIFSPYYKQWAPSVIYGSQRWR